MVSIKKQDIKLAVGVLVAVGAALGGNQAVNSTTSNPTLSKGDIIQLIQQESPYKEDKAYIFSQLDINRLQLTQIQRDLVAVRLSQARLETKVDLLLRRP